ncbi:MAG TPA: GNAT family N-acetyltransferase [Acidimicrobiales bacterium]|nr:GNAT family N-acetyltransferase [Acidimicrobiales bacterium]
MKTGSVVLRPAGEGDEAILRRVYRSTREDELALTGWDEAQKEAFVSMQFEAQRRYYVEQYAGASFDVVVVDGEPAGRLYVARWPDEIRIVDIALLPAYRNRGVGGLLLRQVLAEGSERGHPVTIHVERFNPALRLYDRLGFVPAADRGVYLLLRWDPA